MHISGSGQYHELLCGTILAMLSVLVMQIYCMRPTNFAVIVIFISLTAKQALVNTIDLWKVSL